MLEAKFSNFKHPLIIQNPSFSCLSTLLAMSEQNPLADGSQDLLASMAQLQQDIATVAARQAESEKSHSEALHSIQFYLQSLSLPPAVSNSPRNLVRDLPKPSPLSSEPLHSSRLKPATPSDFSGDRTKGRAFLNTCNTYLRLCPQEFASDQEKILWVLSFMKDGRAARWADQIFRWEEKNEEMTRFLDWKDFLEEFQSHFLPVSSEAAAINRLEGIEYFQRNRSVEDYLDEFLELISDSGYEDKKTIVIKFRRGLRPTIQTAVATMTANRPSDNSPEAWYKAAQLVDQSRAANEAFQALGRSQPRSSAPLLRSSAPPPTPVSLPTSSIAAPMDVDLTRKPSPLPPVCFRCKKPGHIKANCPLRYDVRFLDTEEKEELIQQFLAEKDAAEAQEESQEAEIDVEGDFRSSSR